MTVKVTFFPNGNCITFDDDGEQIPELNVSYVIMHAEKAKALGYDPTEIEYTLVDGARAEVFEIEDGFNYQITR